MTTELTNPNSDLLGVVRRSPEGTRLAVLWPSPPHPARWMVTDRWGSTGYEADEVVAAWPIVGAVPCSPAAGMTLAEPKQARAGKRYRITDAHLDEVASAYTKARKNGQGPTRAVADHFNVAHSTAAKWVGRARTAGLLPPWTAADLARTEATR
ncbi:hypothetical protein ACL02U_11850 [Streptomyces sp. MS06]|uniref:hypothetical protein n=1 Tax=Streptomyces sp. MS06 TaxID=3385974 RepID=UPI0039A1A12E